MNKKRIISISIWVLFYNLGFSQNQQKTTLSLEDCIQIAFENNFDLKKSELRSKSSIINYKQSRAALLPNLNANYNLGMNNGRSIDPFTNSYSTQKLNFSNAGLSLNATIFNGFKIKNSIKQNKLNMLASEMDIAEAKQNLILNITLQYIQVLNNRDIVSLSKSRLRTTESQLKRLEVNYKQEVGDLVNYTDMKGQYSLDEIGVINAENNLKLSIINLYTLLNRTPNSKKKIENISGIVEMEKYPFSTDEIYHDALRNLATFKSKEYKIKAAKAGIKVSKANYFPEISVFGQLNTNYSSAAQVFTETGNTIIETGDFVTFTNQNFAVQRNETQFKSNKISYTDQFNNNLNSVVGISVRIPIFNGLKTKYNTKLQKIKLEETTLELQNTKLLFKQVIEKAYLDMESAYKRYQISQQQVIAFEESFRINEVKFSNGISNIINYITSKNNRDIAKLNLNNTKYEYLLRVKILDYYRGI